MLHKFIYVLLIITLFSGLIVVAQDAESTEAPDAQQILAEAHTLVEDARVVQEHNFTVVDTIMNMIQLGGIFVAIVTAGAVIIGGANIREFRDKSEEIRNKITELNILKTELENEIASLQQAKDEVTSIADNLNTLPDTVDKKMAEQRDNANTNIQALSLVQFAIQQNTIGNRHAALNTLTRASEIQEDNPVISYFRGEILVRSGEYEQGIPFLEIAAKSGDMPEASGTLAYAYRMMGDLRPEQSDKYYSIAESIYTNLREQYPDLLDITGESIYGALAGLYRNRNMIDKAIQTYEQIERVTPNSSYPNNNLGLLHFEYADRPYTDRNKGKEYFEKSRRKARAAMRLEGKDYWRLFDIITAEIALEEFDCSRIIGLLDDMFDLGLIADDIQKLQRGVIQLQKSEQPPECAATALDYIETRLRSMTEAI